MRWQSADAKLSNLLSKMKGAASNGHCAGLVSSARRQYLFLIPGALLLPGRNTMPVFLRYEITSTE